MSNNTFKPYKTAVKPRFLPRDLLLNNNTLQTNVMRLTWQLSGLGTICCSPPSGRKCSSQLHPTLSSTPREAAASWLLALQR